MAAAARAGAVKQEQDILKNHRGVLAGGIVSRYRFIAQQRTHYLSRQLCGVLNVSASGIYAWLNRQSSRRLQAYAALAERIRAMHERSRQTYGYPRELRASVEQVGKQRVARLMSHGAGHQGFTITP